MADEPTKVPETGLAMLDAEEGGSLTPRARARAQLADSLIAEAQAILDEPLPDWVGSSPSAEATRARNRAEFRWKRAAAAARNTYGERTQVDARVTATVALVVVDLSTLLPTPAPQVAAILEPTLAVHGAPALPEPTAAVPATAPPGVGSTLPG